MRNLILILGDQLDPQSAAFDGFDAELDAVWMAEVHDESARTWSSKPRIALFLACLRHFAASLRERGWTVHYRTLDESVAEPSLDAALSADISRLQPTQLVCVEPGEYGVRERIRRVANVCHVTLDERADRHFLTSHAEFRAHAAERKQLRMEYFYRAMRKRYAILLDDGEPVGGQWNYDSENRKGFGKRGPQNLTAPMSFAPDTMTREVLADVARQFASHPGDLAAFDWPVTRAQALAALEDFIARRLPLFGEHQDAMWLGEPYLFHARISAALNLKLLNPREVIAAAERAYREDAAPLGAVEGFIRQILGWREYVRGVYWLHMPTYLDGNTLDAQQPLPAFYWTGDTDMTCLREAIGQTLRLGYAHHIQRLMVTGLFALLVGVEPRRVHEWYLGVYVDAVEWVELPNTLGMSQYADGGVMASKPYVASGRYIDRMSNYCSRCRYDPTQRIGASACPFTTLYWDFLMRHERTLRSNRRMDMQMKNLAAIAADERRDIRQQTTALRQQLAASEVRA
jgi:deoxyribodipyrimidine photolyase-related protein